MHEEWRRDLEGGPRLLNLANNQSIINISEMYKFNLEWPEHLRHK